MEKTNFRSRPLFFICTVLGFLLTLLGRIYICNATESDNFADNPGLCGDGCEDSEGSWIWNEFSSFIQGFVIGWVLFSAYCLALLLFQFPSKTINKIVSLNKWKLRRTKEHLNSGSEEELSSHLKILKLEKFAMRMSYTELAKATCAFSEEHLVGNGMLGKMYKAILANGWTVAIKKLNECENLEDDFVSEITTLGGLKHRNLLPLIGFCVEMEERFLVYKYMPNGNLHQWLHLNEEKGNVLDFSLRVQIAERIAKGLAWLHYGYKSHVTHGNISTRCILLDQNFEPKISDFWEARIWSKNDTVSWSLFPLAEYSSIGSYKQDVYCFGIVLLKLVTGKEPHELTSSRNLFDHSPCLLDVDKDFLGKGINDLILKFLELACDCVKFFPNERPTMLEVHDTLKAISQGRSD